MGLRLRVEVRVRVRAGVRVTCTTVIFSSLTVAAVMAAPLAGASRLL